MTKKTETQNATIPIVKKLSPKILNDGKKPKVIDDKETLICQIIGVVNDTKEKDTDFGVAVALKGQFQGTNLTTGEMLKSYTLYIPEIVSDMILGQLNLDGISSVEFAFDIGVRPNKDSATGYVYYCNPLLVNENDPIADIQKRLTAQ